MKYAIIPTCLVLALAAGCGNKTGDAGKKEGGDVAVVNGKAISRSTFDFYVQGVNHSFSVAPGSSRTMLTLTRGRVVSDATVPAAGPMRAEMNTGPRGPRQR